MKERPILFSVPMVRAILDNRKTQTRRIIKPTPQMISDRNIVTWDGDAAALMRLFDSTGVECKYGQSGDQLWVRETWSSDDGRTAHYRADGETYNHGLPWKPSIHMPRWASRITLEITGVRVERLQDIGAEDAIAEGLKGITKDRKLVKYGIPDSDGYPGTDDTGWPWEEWRISPVDAYRKLWESINGPGSWAANPWVWVIEFVRVKS